MKTIIVILTIIFFAFASGCSLGTIKSQMKNSDFKNQITPTREIRILVFYDNHWTEEEIERLIEETNEILEPQVGIKLKVITKDKIRCE